MNEIVRQVDFPGTREEIAAIRPELLQMLTELSDDALAYVWRPIMYAYYYTDARDQDRMTDEDSQRFSLIGAAAQESAEFVQRLNLFANALFHTRMKQRREATQCPAKS